MEIQENDITKMKYSIDINRVKPIASPNNNAFIIYQSLSDTHISPHDYLPDTNTYIPTIDSEGDVIVQSTTHLGNIATEKTPQEFDELMSNKSIENFITVSIDDWTFIIIIAVIILVMFCMK